MTAQELLDELISLQKQGYDLDSMEVSFIYDEYDYKAQSCGLDDIGIVLYS